VREAGYDVALEGTDALICDPCIAEHVPELIQARAATNGAARYTGRTAPRRSGTRDPQFDSGPAPV
jgi:hypothetical protein